MTSYAAEVLGMSTGLALVGLLVVVPLVCLGIVLLSRHVSIRREESLHRDFHEQRLDIERRERRLTERESRLDAEAAALAEREHAVEKAEDDRRATLDLAHDFSVVAGHISE